MEGSVNKVQTLIDQRLADATRVAEEAIYAFFYAIVEGCSDVEAGNRMMAVWHASARVIRRTE